MGRHWALGTERVRCNQSQPTVIMPGTCPYTHFLDPRVCASPWEELLPWMVMISEVSWELAPLLT